MATYTDVVIQAYGGGVKVLEVPIGTPQYVKGAMEEIVNELQGLFNLTTELEDMHLTFPFYRYFAGASRLIYLQRAVPKTFSKNATLLLDTAITGCVRTLDGGELPPGLMAELSLPLQPHPRSASSPLPRPPLLRRPSSLRLLLRIPWSITC